MLPGKAGADSRQVEIHPTAIVSPQAAIGEGSSIGPYSIVGPKVVIGKRNRIASHVVLEGNTKLGDDNQLFQFCSIGAAPQDLKYRGEDSVLEIGNKNLIREFVTIQPGTEGGGMKTKIGDQNLFMANSHIGHDCLIGNSNVIANSAAVAGHVTIGNQIVAGGLIGVHQFVRIGDHAIIGAGAMIAQDIPPFCVAQGDRARLFGINVIGLERRGIEPEQIKALKLAYRKLFLAKGRLQDKVKSVLSELGSFPCIEQLCTFVVAAERGIARAGKE